MKLAGALVLLGAALLLTSGGGGYYCVEAREAGSPGSHYLYPQGSADA